MKKRRLAFISTVCGLLALSVFGGVKMMQKDTMTAEAAPAIFVEGQIEESYEYGSFFTLPSSVQIEYEGQEYTASKGYLIYPNGCAYSSMYAYTLDVFGKYKVVYEAEVDGKTIFAEHEFDVGASVYSLDGESSLSYDTLRAFSVYDNLTSEQRAEGKRMGTLLTDVKGLKINFVADDTFTYNRPINIYENSYNEILSFNAVQLQPEAKMWSVRLTDCYDPSIYMEISFSKPRIDETYARVGAYGLATVGLRESATAGGDIVMDGKAYNKDNNGTPVTGNRSIDITPSLGQDRYNNITIALDTTDKQGIKVYIKNISARGEEPNNRFAAQLNNPSLYAYEFKGFTNGDVYLSLTAKDFSGVQESLFEIASIMGDSGEALRPKAYVDETPPEIWTDAPEGEINIVAGSPIPIPKAYARDVSGLSAPVDYSVWYNYDSESRRMLQVKDGTFTPDNLGKYTVEYYAVDAYGNRVTKRLDMLAVKQGEEAIDFTCEHISNVVAGDYVCFNGYNVESLTPIKDMKITVVLPSGETQEIQNPNEQFLLSAAGTYKVKYEYADLFYKGEYEYSFEVEDAGKYSFDGEIATPRYLIKNASYSFEKINLYRYSGSAPQLVDVKTYISYDDKNYEEMNESSVTISGNKHAFIKYVCADDSTIFIKSEAIPILDVGYKTIDFNKGKYFVGSFTPSTSEDVPDRTTYTYKRTSTSKPQADFINALSLSSFSLRFAIPKDQTTTSAITLRLTDYYNHDNQVKLTFKKGAGEALFSFNDGEAIALGVPLTGAPFDIAYEDGGMLRIGDTRVSCPINFTMELCLLTLEFEGFGKDSKFEIFSVCGQSFGHYVTIDTSLPMLSAARPEAVAKIGDVIDVAKPVYADVLSPNTADNCKVSVYKNGKAITSIGGVLLSGISDFSSNHQFKIDGYGTYLIVYEYRDGSGLSTDLRYPIMVTDNEAPTFAFKNYNGGEVGVSVGVKTDIIEYTASDNYTAEGKLQVWAFVYDEQGICVSAQRNSFTVNKAGKYEVHVYCFDNAGNMASAVYKINAR